jgi:hypothetical protein
MYKVDTSDSLWSRGTGVNKKIYFRQDFVQFSLESLIEILPEASNCRLCLS